MAKKAGDDNCGKPNENGPAFAGPFSWPHFLLNLSTSSNAACRAGRDAEPVRSSLFGGHLLSFALLAHQLQLALSSFDLGRNFLLHPGGRFLQLR